MELVGCTFHPKILQTPKSECNSSRLYYGVGGRSSSKNANKQSFNNTQNTINIGVAGGYQPNT